MEKLTGLLKSEKATKIIFAVGIALIIIIFLFSLSSDKKEETAEEIPQKSALSEIEEYEQRLERRLTEMIREIDGAGGNVKVMIILEKTEESLYSERETNVSATVTPTVRGAVVICGGAENAVVKQRISEAVCKALGISAAHVCVTY